MAKLTAEEFADKQARRLKASTEDIRKGIDNVTEAPGKKAARKKDKFRANLMTAIDNGSWERNVAAVTVDDWKTQMKTKGLNNISQGIDNARSKVVSFASKLLPFQDSLKNEIDKMPDTTMEDRINKSAAWQRGMAKFKK